MIPCAAHWFDPMASSSRPTVRCRKTKSSDDFSDDDDDYALAVPQTGVSSINPVIKIDTNCNLPLLVQVGPVNHREEVRRQRIESEQRRRDELRDGYRRLKEVLPVSNQKSSKVSLLDRGTDFP